MKTKIFFFICLLASIACSDNNVDVPTTEEEVTLEIGSTLVNFEAAQSGQNIIVKSNKDWTVSVENEVNWVSARKSTSGLQITVSTNKSSERKTKVLVSTGEITKSIDVVQKAGKPGIDDFEKDILQPVTKGTASEHQSGNGIELTFDKNHNTMYHSRFNGATELPVTLQYFFENVDRIDYVTIYARSTGVNGNFQEFDVYTKTKLGLEEKIGSYDFKGAGITQNITLELENPEYIKFVVKSGVGGYVSCDEMEFYKSALSSSIVDNIFTDKSYSELKQGVTMSEINKIDNDLLKYIATELFSKTYETAYRVQKYKPVLSPTQLGKNLKIGDGFSRYEGITGIYLPEGESVVFVSNTKGKAVILMLPNWMRQPTPGYDPTKDPQGWGLHVQTIPLKEGVNIIDSRYSTNAYINYTVDVIGGAQDVTVHFPQGAVNGYFDASKHTDQDWNQLLDNAVSPIMDAKGKYIQVAYPVKYFKQFAYSRGLELINNYDKMLLNHYTFMGLKKYDRLPDNRILSRVNFNYYMFRDQDGVAYLGNENTMGMVVNPTAVIKGDPCWGFSHEVGHVLQMRPQLTWGGLTEVSNNLYTLSTTIGLGNRSRLQDEGHYAQARAAIINKKISYLQDENDFHRLVPFWQLHLYFSRNGNSQFYADVMEKMRNTPHAGLDNNSYKNMFEYIKICCDIGKVDLTDFFDKWGFFYVGQISLVDYGQYNYNITQQEVDETKAYIASKKYPKPSVDITLLED